MSSDIVARCREMGIDNRLLETLRGAFDVYDIDGNGSISASELGITLRSVGISISNADANEMVAKYDSDGNGSLEFGEFISLAAKGVRRNAVGNAFDAFRHELFDGARRNT